MVHSFWIDVEFDDEATSKVNWQAIEAAIEDAINTFNPQDVSIDYAGELTRDEIDNDIDASDEGRCGTCGRAG